MDQQPSVLSKRQNYRLWQGGAYGNKLRSWRSVASWRESGFSGMVVLRTLMGGNGPCLYNLTRDEAEGELSHWIWEGIPYEKITVDEAAPAERVILQGEYLNDICELDGQSCWGYFKHSRMKVQMRDALRRQPLLSRGLRSDLLLRESMSPSSYSDWQLLLETYPGHVLEVSVYEGFLGDIPGRNALVWEARRY